MHKRRTARALWVGILALTGSGLCCVTADADSRNAVTNGDLARPAVSAGSSVRQAPESWNGTGDLYAANLAKHPGELQAFDLNADAAGTLSQTLTGVKQGSAVTVYWSDAPHVDDPAGTTRRYRVEADGATAKEVTTLAAAQGSVAWRTGNSYRFTADRDDPVLRFTSQETGERGALVSGVRAPSTAAAPDPTRPAGEMPPQPGLQKPALENADPCNEGGSTPSGCAEHTGNQTEIAACSPKAAGCLDTYATTGQATRQDLGATSTMVEKHANKDRQASPHQAAGPMCGIFAQHTGRDRPDQYEYRPTTHNCAVELPGQDLEQPVDTPQATLTRLPDA
ncbi:hypothetical protein ACFY7C_02100 [Streptomyces sp. NPDC012769]|uniref:hypothetical protein n=1 Tax=Streptomyces sp. NPDC012769 TaxID=3364848 RepID=UPI0036C8A907